MSYELCGPAACTVFPRTSTDGWNFGTASNMGAKVTTTSGQWEGGWRRDCTWKLCAGRP